MLPPELTAAIASLAQRDQMRRVGSGKRKTAPIVIPEASLTQAGTVQLASDGQDAPNVAVQGNDYRLPQIIKKSADQSTSSFAPIDDDDLWFEVEAGRCYHFRFVCAMRSALATMGFRISLTFPSATVSAASARLFTSTDGPGAEAQGAILSSGDILTFNSVPAANDDYIGIIEGLIVPTASGVVQLMFSSETGSGGLLVTIRRGSVGFIYDLGA